MKTYNKIKWSIWRRYNNFKLFFLRMRTYYNRMMEAKDWWDDSCENCGNCGWEKGEGYYCDYWEEGLDKDYSGIRHCYQCGDSENYTELEGFEKKWWVFKYAWYTARGYEWRYNSKTKKTGWYAIKS